MIWLMEQLCKIRELYRAIARFEASFIEQHQLSLNEGMLLCCLQQHGTSTAGQIAELLELTSSNTSKVIRAVEEKGLINRILCKSDKRQMCFELSAEGRKKIKQIETNAIPLDLPLQHAFEQIGACHA